MIKTTRTDIITTGFILSINILSCTQMNKQGIDYNTRFHAVRESGIGEGLETGKSAHTQDRAPGDFNSTGAGDLMMYRQRAQNAYQQGLRAKNLAFEQLRN